MSWLMSLDNPFRITTVEQLVSTKTAQTFGYFCETAVAQSFYIIIRVKAVTSHKIQSETQLNIWLGGLGIPDITVQKTFLRLFTSLASFANINDRCEAANELLTWICITVKRMHFWGKHEMINWIYFWLGKRLHDLNKTSVMREELDNVSKWLHQAN